MIIVIVIKKDNNSNKNKKGNNSNKNNKDNNSNNNIHNNHNKQNQHPQFCIWSCAHLFQPVLRRKNRCFDVP